MYVPNKFPISDENYVDNIRTNPLHYNSMRTKPTYPVSLIENNLSSVKSYPNNWAKTKDEWKFFRNDAQFKKRCLFDYDDQNQKVHLRSIDTLSNQHLLEPTLKFPEEDYIYQVLGKKKLVDNKRNDIPEKSPGDKTYKTVEYSKEFFYRNNVNWRNQKNEKPSKYEELSTQSTDIFALLNLDPSVNLFSNKNDIGYEYDPKQEKQDEIEDVKHLDSWKRATPLEVPFKVLDLADKTIKYRPKVTR